MANRKSIGLTAVTQPTVDLKPLAAGIKWVLAGSMMLGAPLSRAELPVPDPARGWVASGRADQALVDQGQTLQIDQHTDKLILNWKSFDVGKDNTVKFVQPGSSSIALNRIYDQNPSSILGKVVANGQVYLFNQNGFLFGKDAVVNTNSLVATALNISDDVFQRGITRVFDEDGRAALAIEAGSGFNAATSKILIDAGAKIHVDAGGRIILAAPTIENNGSLAADANGQIIMAASEDKVYLQAADSASPFSGLLVEVDTGGKVENVGSVLAKEGNITLAGYAVNQSGRLTATTSVDVNGSIRLLAREQHTAIGDKLSAASTVRGEKDVSTVTFKKDSVTEVQADQDGGSAVDEQEQHKSYIEVNGHDVAMMSGSTIQGPSAQVEIEASDSVVAPAAGNSGRFWMENGATIDVSGSTQATVAMERNIGEISVQSYDLRDAPLQKDGPLKGETVKVDLRKQTEIVDTSGARDRIKRGIEERLAEGGEVNITAAGDAVINKGAKIDIAGGSVRYLAGTLSTTKLMDQAGRIVDISDADPNETYVKVFDTVKSVNGDKVEKNPLPGNAIYQAGYKEGKDAGSVNITSRHLAWNGTLAAGAQAGVFQRAAGAQPDGGRFSFDSSIDANVAQNVSFRAGNSNEDIALGQDFPLDDLGRSQTTVLSSRMLSQSGVEHVEVKTYGNVDVAESANIKLAAGGDFKVEAPSIDVQGQVQVAGGTIALSNIGSGGVLIGPRGRLNVSGRWVNDYSAGLGADPLGVLAVNGGSVIISSLGDLTVQAGAQIRADGGAWLSQTGTVTAGDGGSIALIAGNSSRPGRLSLDGSVSAAAMGKAGSLTLSSDAIVVGNGDGTGDEAMRLKVTGAGRFAFDPKGGFGSVELIGNVGGVSIEEGTVLNLKTANLVLRDGFLQKPSDSDIRGFSDLVMLPEHLRAATHLSLSGLLDVVLGTGSSISVDKRGSVELVTNRGGIYIDGTINAPGGSIRAAIESIALDPYVASQSVWLGEHAQILAQGTVIRDPVDAFGKQNGEVLDGGEVSFDVQRGGLVFEQGSLIDVSGTHSVLDVPVQGKPATVTKPTEVFGDAGSVDISVAEAAIFDGKIVGLVSSDGARGGRFSFTFDRDRRLPDPFAQIPFPDGPLLLLVRDEQQGDYRDEFGFGDDIPESRIGQALLSAQMLEQGGFSDIRLQSPDSIVFQGRVDLTAAARIDLNAPVIAGEALNGVDADISLAAALVRLGSSLTDHAATAPQWGSGAFSAQAQWLELQGAAVFDGFGSVKLSSAYDMRTVGNLNITDRGYFGELRTAADLTLTASQIYPTTLSQYLIRIENNPQGKLTIVGSGNSSVTPLSAAGKLTLQAANIVQGGTLRAPLGSLQLQAGESLVLADGSLTSVSAAGAVIPFGVTQAELDWLYVLDSVRNLVFDTPPEKSLLLQAPDVELAAGSTVDLSGGGDLYAYEFLTGAGGTYDYLDPNSAGYSGGFAILPSLGSELAPFDHYENTTVGWDYAIGSKVYLSGSNGLPAGEYVILPAHYALLPGAFLVTPQAGSLDQTQNIATVSGLSVVTGYFTDAGTNARDARWSGFLLETGEQLRLHSEYAESGANDFYADKAAKNETAVPLLPQDSGQIALLAGTRLVLQSEFLAEAFNGGRGARMDIASGAIRVVNALSETPEQGVLEVSAEQLNALKVDSLLLGGARQRDKASGATNVEVFARQVVFAAGAQLAVKDLSAAASDTLAVESGAVLSAQGEVNTGDSVLNVVGDGALLRVSGDEQVVLQRQDAPGAGGRLSIQEGASLTASGSMLLDASQSTLLQGDIAMQHGSLNLSANSMNLGEVDDLDANALNLSNRKLLDLQVDELVLSVRNGLNLYGNVQWVDSAGQAVLDENGQAQPISFGRLVIDSPIINGYGADGDLAGIQADSLRLQNSFTTTSAGAGGSGNLRLSADTVEIGDGKVGLQGFAEVAIAAHKQLRADGDGGLNVAADLTLTTPAITAANGAQLDVDASGHALNIQTAAAETVADASGFGARIGLTADSIAFNTRLSLPTGELRLDALQGDISLGDNAQIDLAGRSYAIADSKGYTGGGNLYATAQHGGIGIAEQATLNLNGGGGSAKGGQLHLSAVESSVRIDGQIQNQQGRAFVDVGQFAAGGFDGLVNTLAEAGVTDTVYLRSRNDDLVQGAGSTLKAANITLISDNGSIDSAGTLNADGTETGGAIRLYAGDLIRLNGATLSATGIKGGSVLLSATDSDGDGNSGIVLAAGATIDVGNGTATATGTTKLQGGEVTLRTLRDGNGVLLTDNGATVKGYAEKAAVYDADGQLTEYGYRQFFIEAVKRYQDDNGFLTADDYAAIQADTAAYMSAANMQAVTDTFGARLLAGVEVVYAGDLMVVDKWDLADWRYSERDDWVAMPGSLTLRAAGDVSVYASLSDGFKDGVLPSPFGDIPFTDMLQGGESWNLRVVAGADLASADWQASGNAGDLLIGPNVAIRTGSGDIALSAGGDVVFSDQTSVVYNAGRISETNPYGSMDLLMAIGALPYLYYPVDGGDLTISAGGNIQGAQSSQFIDAWMGRQGSSDRLEDAYLASVAADLASLKDDAAGLQAYIDSLPDNLQKHIYDGYKLDSLAYSAATTWGLSLGNGVFQQNVGSFGGGSVQISAGGDINDLSVMMPTTGKQTGDPAYDPNNPSTLGFITNQVEVNGGGTLQVTAGNDIAGGLYYLGAGSGNLQAGGSIVGGGQYSNGAQLLLGDTQMTLQANREVVLAGVSDPMIMQPEAQGSTNFFSYSDGSSLSVFSLGGDVHLGGNIQAIEADLNTTQKNLAVVYPASLDVRALSGSVVLDDAIALFPSPDAQLVVFADQDIKSDGLIQLGMSDADRALLPDALTPIAAGSELQSVEARLQPFGLNTLVHAAVPVHSGDETPVYLVAQNGSIENVQFSLAKKAVIRTGRDFKDVILQIQHANADDVSILAVGRDLKFTSSRDLNGALNGNNSKINVSGPGDLFIQTGRHFDLGAAKGLYSDGDLINTGLADSGASITVMVGLNGGQPDYAKIVSRTVGLASYGDELAPAKTRIVEYMNALVANNPEAKQAVVAYLRDKLAGELHADTYALSDEQVLKLFDERGDLKVAAFQALPSVYTLELQLALNALPDYAAAVAAHTKAGEQTLVDDAGLQTARNLIVNFVRNSSGDADMSEGEALQQFAALPADEYAGLQPLLNDLLLPGVLAVIKEAGTQGAISRQLADYQPGYQAIQSLFPAADWNGDLSMVFSTIQTLDDGNINLFVPGGSVNVGLAAAVEAKKDSELGIIAQGKGDVNLVIAGFRPELRGLSYQSDGKKPDAAKGSLFVNQSRIFTLGDGNILAWSSDGDIDAGRGAKSALDVPSAIITYDENGDVQIQFPPSVSGSGIRPSGRGKPFLFAPVGKIDAGEAGIGCAAGCVLGSATLANASNIDVGKGGGIGVPNQNAAAPALPAGVSNLNAAVGQMAESSATKAGGGSADSSNQAALGLLSVEVLGFGEPGGESAGGAAGNSGSNKPKGAL
ncbi:filamentous haemagglutinin family protein [Methylomonas sp. HYX-M1]|uniref:filamentous haemagglutinin family protein n=1 Tax=Methylomonas sp. HYX-M1 TaxID=3139307 RepID=UPI00345B9239